MQQIIAIFAVNGVIATARENGVVACARLNKVIIAVGLAVVGVNHVAFGVAGVAYVNVIAAAGAFDDKVQRFSRDAHGGQHRRIRDSRRIDAKQR